MEGMHVDSVVAFEAERPRLLRLAARVLGNSAEAEDIVQQAWLRLDRTDQDVNNLPGWLTTATTRLCLDRLRARVPIPEDDIEPAELHPDPADEVALADTVGIALAVVLDRLTPAERVAFVLHDSFGFEFKTIAAILESTPTAVRKLASRARAKVASFFNGAAKAAFPVFIGDRPGAAWVHRGEAKVAFDFTVADGVVSSIRFRADPDVLQLVRARKGDASA